MANRHLLLAFFTLCTAMHGTLAAFAATPGIDAEAARHAALHALPSACAGDYDRLCPHPLDSTPTASSVLICLKDHMIDTSLSCRKVVRAARQ